MVRQFAHRQPDFKSVRSTDNNTFLRVVASVAATARMFNDTGLNDGTTYYYKVSATSPAGTSTPDSVQGTTLLAAPEDLGAVAANDLDVNLHWTPASASPTGYYVLESTDGENFVTVDTTGPNAQYDTITVPSSKRGSKPITSKCRRLIPPRHHLFQNVATADVQPATSRRVQYRCGHQRVAPFRGGGRSTPLHRRRRPGIYRGEHALSARRRPMDRQRAPARTGLRRLPFRTIRTRWQERIRTRRLSRFPRAMTHRKSASWVGGQATTTRRCLSNGCRYRKHNPLHGFLGLAIVYHKQRIPSRPESIDLYRCVEPRFRPR